MYKIAVVCWTDEETEKVCKFVQENDCYISRGYSRAEWIRMPKFAKVITCNNKKDAFKLRMMFETEGNVIGIGE